MFSTINVNNVDKAKGQRFKKIREELGKSQTELAESIGIKQGTWSDIEKGKPCSYKIINALRDKYGVRSEFIESGKEPKFDKLLINLTSDNNHVGSNVKTATFNFNKGNCIMVPIKAFGGFLAGYSNKAYLDTLEKIPFPWVNGECFAFEVDGFSMVTEDNREESYYPGTWVICTELENFSWMQKGKPYVLATTEGIIIKRFVKIENDKCYLESANPDKIYKVAPIPLKQLKRAFHVEGKYSKPI